MIPVIKEEGARINNDPLTERIIACAYKVHSELGPGFSERIYHNALKFALKEENLGYETEKEYKVSYHDKHVGMLKVDLVVENKVIVEVKAVTGSNASANGGNAVSSRLRQRLYCSSSVENIKSLPSLEQYCPPHSLTGYNRNYA